MHKQTVYPKKYSTSAVFAALSYLLLVFGAADKVQAQEAQPFEFVPLPAGGNLAIGYYLYGHNTEFNVRGGQTVKDSGVETNVGLARYGHYFDVAGHPAAIELFQSFGSLSGAHIGAESLGSTFGAGPTILGAGFWPYADTASSTYVITSLAVYFPDGSYTSTRPLNLGGNRWSGSAQLGISKGIGSNFSFDAAVDAQIYSDNTNNYPSGQTLSQNPSYRSQLWLNWSWSKSFTTSVGWEGVFGGRQQFDGTFNGIATEVQRLRAAASLFITPTYQVLIELNHDVAHSGNFKQDFGATLRFAHVF